MMVMRRIPKENEREESLIDKLFRKLWIVGLLLLALIVVIILIKMGSNPPPGSQSILKAIILSQ